MSQGTLAKRCACATLPSWDIKEAYNPCRSITAHQWDSIYHNKNWSSDFIILQQKLAYVSSVVGLLDLAVALRASLSLFCDPAAAHITVEYFKTWNILKVNRFMVSYFSEVNPLAKAIISWNYNYANYNYAKHQ